MNNYKYNIFIVLHLQGALEIQEPDGALLSAAPRRDARRLAPALGGFRV